MLLQRDWQAEGISIVKMNLKDCQKRLLVGTWEGVMMNEYQNSICHWYGADFGFVGATVATTHE